MLPSINFLGQNLPLYGLFGLLGMFAASFLAYLRGRKQGMVYMDFALGVLVIGLGIVAGGTLLYALVQIPAAWENREYFSQYPLQFLTYMFGGMVFYGGLFGAIIALPIYAKVIKRDVPTILTLLAPVLPLAHGIMRIGCFMAGCCYGLPHDTLGITLAASPIAPNYPVLPVQLYEAAINFGIFAFLWTYSKKPRHHLTLLGLYGTFYGTARFFLEFLRGDPARGQVLGLSTSQFISIFVIAISIFLIIHANRKKPA